MKNEILIATEKQMTCIHRQAVDAIARGMALTGVRLTHEQIDELGDECVDWLMLRLHLHVSVSDDVGVTLVPDYYGREE